MAHKNLPTQVVYEKDISNLTKPGYGHGLFIDLYTFNTITGQKEGIDWTFCTMNPAATQDNPSVKMAAARKLNFYNEATGDVKQHFNLVPAAIDTCGRFGDPLLQWCKRIVASGSLEATTYSRALYHFKTSLAVAHWKAIGAQKIILIKELNQDIGGDLPGRSGFHPHIEDDDL